MVAMHQFINVIVSHCFAALRQLRAVRRYIRASVMQSLVTSLILTRLDYCNSVLFGLTACRTDSSSSGGPECCCMHVLCSVSGDPSTLAMHSSACALVASSRAHPFQGRRHGLQVAAWHITTLLVYIYLRPVFICFRADWFVFSYLASTSCPT